MILAFIQSIEKDFQHNTVQEIYNLYYKQMYATANRILKNHHDTLDAVQDAFYNILNTVDMFENPNTQKVSALTCIYTRNAALNIYNKNKRFSKRFVLYEDLEQSIFDVPDNDYDLLSVILNEERDHLIHEAIFELDEMYREVILLKYFYHMRNIDIAKILYIDVNKVNGRLFRAIKKLKKILDRIGYEPIT